MGQSLGDLHYTLGINDTDLDKQLAAAKAKITAALSGTGGVGGLSKTVKLTNEAAKADLLRSNVLKNEATTLSIAATQQNKKNIADAQSALIIQKTNTEEARREAILNRTAIATERAANSQKRMAEHATFANKTFLSQGVIASQLATILGTTFSIYAVGAFIKKLAEVRGEFELQSVALRAITRDKEAADKIFSQVKTLSVQSPFTFAELLRDTKQLAAFSVETDKLFGTLTRLADVSAGLGVDMNRIILAYGQVRAATVLRGQELRQFTEAGIPIIDMLANKFTKLEGTVVSAGDVFKRISEKMVSFKMVDEIFTELTSSGGMFFEMQKKQSETLAGKLANLKDAYMIMLNAMGSGGAEGVLKGGADFLYTLMTNWSKIADILKVVIATYGTYKAIMLVVNAVEKMNIALEVEKIAVMKSSAAAGIVMSEAQAMATLNTNLLSRAMAGLNATMKANIGVMAIAAIAGLAMWLKNAYDNAHELENALKKIGEEEKGTA
ncbi:MAG: tape measure protein, partial [Verrucomicrobiota bacterium]